MTIFYLSHKCWEVHICTWASWAYFISCNMLCNDCCFWEINYCYSLEGVFRRFELQVCSCGTLVLKYIHERGVYIHGINHLCYIIIIKLQWLFLSWQGNLQIRKLQVRVRMVCIDNRLVYAVARRGLCSLHLPI